MLIPNCKGYLSRRTGKNMYSEPTFAAPKLVECSIIRMMDQVKKTSVRTDSSASRGNAEEIVIIAKILFPVKVVLGQGDKFAIAGLQLKVEGIHQRFDTLGQHDHNEVDFSVWTK